MIERKCSNANCGAHLLSPDGTNWTVEKSVFNSLCRVCRDFIASGGRP